MKIPENELHLRLLYTTVQERNWKEDEYVFFIDEVQCMTENYLGFQLADVVLNSDSLS